jgi:hypothetical protein
MTTTTTVILPANSMTSTRGHRRRNPVGLGLALLGTVGLYLALPIAAATVGQVAAPLGNGAVGLLELVVLVAGCGAMGWYLRSWWLPLVAPLPGLGGALLLYRLMVSSDAPDMGFLIFPMMALLGMGLMVTVGTTIGVVIGKLTRTV